MAQGGTALGTDLTDHGHANAGPVSGAHARVSAYGPLCTLFYDVDKPCATAEELAWYRTRLPGDGGLVLEAMAGSGRLLVPLSAAGLRMHGVDASEAMLARCAARLREAGCEAHLFRQNIAALNVPFRYGAAFIAAGSLQLLNAEDTVREALGRIRAHLVEPAILLLDLFVPDAALHPPGAPKVEFRSVTLADGSQVVLRSETACDPERRRIRTSSRYERRSGGQIVEREDERLETTWYAEEEMLALLQRVGFGEVRIEPPPRPCDDGRAFGVSARA
jgi:hypothetical protein